MGSVFFSLTLVSGFIIPKLGLKHSMVLGMVVNGLSSAAFAFLPLVSDGSMFLYLSLAIRVMQSLGSATSEVAGFAYIMDEENLAMIFVSVEAFRILGTLTT